MKPVLVLLLFITTLAYTQDHSKYVNPFIGTGGHGHTYPGATTPFGFVQLSPDTRNNGYSDWDGCSGYHYSDSIIYGFSHTHLSGTGVADYCDVLLMPYIDNRKQTGQEHESTISSFSHSNEHASPGYYSVLLEDDSISVELTATSRVGMHKYLFPASKDARILLDLTHRDQLLDGSYIEIVSPTKIQGLRRSSSWAKDQWLYFAIEFSSPFYIHAIFDGDIGPNSTTETIVSGTKLKSYFGFKTNGNDPVYVKCALSPVSCAGAWKNMQAELPGWDFDPVKQQARDNWNKELSKVEIKSPEDESKSLTDPTNKLVIFYTALYHCMLAPNIYEDVDGKYRGRDNKIHVADDFDYYTVFSLWDTYRALHPLLTIIDQKRTNDFINTFLKQYEQGGRLPVWELSSNETDCMIGYHSVSVIADAAVKGISDFDYELALEAMKHSANLDIYGLKYYKEKGFIESNEEPESVSKALEYGYDDWCIAQMANIVNGKDSIYDHFMRRSANGMNLFNNYFMQPRMNGGWYSPFDPKEVNFNYTEANAWQYSFSYTHMLHSVVSMNPTLFESQLDKLFAESTQTTGREQSDITGLIGQYAHGNEPSHHIAWLYNYCNAPWKTEQRVQQILFDFYKNSPDGLIGNEDCGQMSAWYVLSSMGLYQVNPGYPTFDISTPIFNKIVIHLDNGKSFTISTDRSKDGILYIQPASLDWQHQVSKHIQYKEIMNGGEIKYTLSETPDKNWQFVPPLPVVQTYNAGPVIEASSNSFTDSMLVTITPFYPEQRIYYTVDGSNPVFSSPLYEAPFYIDQTSTIKAITILRDGQMSGVITAKYKKLDHAYSIQYLTAYNTQYTAGGAAGLIDGLRGSADFRTGMWQGWQGENMEVVLDLGETKTITKAGAGFLQDVKSWIWMPSKLEIYISDNGKNYKLITTINNTIPGDNYDSKEIQNLITEFTSVKTRYIKFVAVNAGTVPAWHPGKGGMSWVFCDEVWVE